MGYNEGEEAKKRAAKIAPIATLLIFLSVFGGSYIKHEISLKVFLMGLFTVGTVILIMIYKKGNGGAI